MSLPNQRSLRFRVTGALLATAAVLGCEPEDVDAMRDPGAAPVVVNPGPTWRRPVDPDQDFTVASPPPVINPGPTTPVPRS